MSQPWPAPPAPPRLRSNGVATASLVVGIVAALAVVTVVFCVLAFIPGVAAIVLGVLGLRRAREHPAGVGRGSAVAGIVCGTIATMASIALIAVVVLFVTTVDLPGAERRPALADEYELSEQTCVVRNGDVAVSSGVLVNRSGEAHGFAVTVRFLDRGAELGAVTESLQSFLADGESWAWEVRFPVARGQVNTDGLDCEVAGVEIADIDPL
jgi:hypothetical protein